MNLSHRGVGSSYRLLPQTPPPQRVSKITMGQGNSSKCTIKLSLLHDVTQDISNHVPIFEETCRLLYHSHPDELLTFVNFAQLVRDHEAQGDSAFARKCRKEFFYHRAINALPKFKSVEATPSSPDTVRAYCQLLLKR